MDRRGSHWSLEHIDAKLLHKRIKDSGLFIVPYTAAKPLLNVPYEHSLFTHLIKVKHMTKTALIIQAKQSVREVDRIIFFCILLTCNPLLLVIKIIKYVERVPI